MSFLITMSAEKLQAACLAVCRALRLMMRVLMCVLSIFVGDAPESVATLVGAEKGEIFTFVGARWGGGRPSMCSLTFEELNECEIEYGTVDELSAGGLLRIERVLETDEQVDDLRHRIIAIVPLRTCLYKCSR